MNPSQTQSSLTPAQSRDAILQALTEPPLDLLVVGGGIVGAGVARDAALRGLRVGLVEQHDFAFGTSSRSSRLLHGGLRYLAQGRVRLVHEASVEKRILHRIAPHLAEPLPFIFPTYRGTDWPLWQLRIGVKIYDLLCGGRNLGRSSSLNRTEIQTRLPNLEPAGLTGGVRYFDALTNDARLVIDSLRSAARRGALLANYLQFKSASFESGQWVCGLEDRVAHRELSVQSRAIINATGPWSELVPHSRVKLRLTKGIHMVVERDRLPVPEAVAITQGERLLFVIPWSQRVIIGTTDTDYRGSIEEVRALPEDIDYLLRTVNDFFPSTALSELDILSTWAGLRPLIVQPARRAVSPAQTQAADEVLPADGAPSELTRSHEILNPEPGWWDLAGGKLTTYRLMAEQAVDQVVRWLKSSNRLSPDPLPCHTADEPLLPPAETTGVSGILPPSLDRAVVEHFCGREWAVHLDDVMVRRTGWHYYLPDAPNKAVQVADWMAESLGWTSETRAAELAAYERLSGESKFQSLKSEF